ncbi:MAG: hypothetical protein IJZ76_00495 [Lachnospiraceae bacterium]|nr:hypothetical protein [Lachnospiraceae bacterium]
MNRLGIYVVYDREKNVHSYIENVLEELKKYVTSLIVVCNFDKIEKGLEYIQPYADQIVYRENRGYDAGAYKDVLSGFEPMVFKGYDELLLTNDTYFGPIYPFSTMFSRMDAYECDFWGITRHPSGEMSDGVKYDSHIQSYFLNFKKKVLHSDDFTSFWLNLLYPTTFQEAVQKFELGINHFLREKGYKGAAYMDLHVPNFPLKESENPYYTHSLELVRDMEIPIIKKKIFDLGNPGYINALQAISYLEENRIPNVKYIDEWRINSPFSYQEVKRFVDSHEKIYIYGKGMWGRNLAELFRQQEWEFEDFLITEKRENEDGCIFSEKILSERDGIIIAIGDETIVEEIYRNILSVYEPGQVLKSNMNQ